MITSLVSPSLSHTPPASQQRPAAAVANPYDSVQINPPAAPGPAPAPGKFDAIRSNAGFVGAVGGTAIGIGLSVASGISGSGLFWGSLIGAWGGNWVGNVVANADNTHPTPLPPAVQTFKKNAATIGTIAGVGAGLALAFAGGHPSGGTVLLNSLFGALGGLWTGRIIENS